jgi:hypothetical protein
MAANVLNAFGLSTDSFRGRRRRGLTQLASAPLTWPVKTVLLPLLLITLLLPACATRRAAEPKEASPAPGASTPAPTVTPAAGHTGRIASVKANLRFVVVDFSLSTVPADGTTLGVFRAGQKVGEIRVTGPTIGSNTAADLVAGEAQTGDEVRER